jgi:hypothetical protein
MAEAATPLEIPLDPKHLEEIQKATGNVMMIRGHIVQGKLTITGIQHVIPSPFAHNWSGGSAFEHNWPSS